MDYNSHAMDLNSHAMVHSLSPMDLNSQATDHNSHAIDHIVGHSLRSIGPYGSSQQKIDPSMSDASLLGPKCRRHGVPIGLLDV
jgi:hypothetical protein